MSLEENLKKLNILNSKLIIATYLKTKKIYEFIGFAVEMIAH